MADAFTGVDFQEAQSYNLILGSFYSVVFVLLVSLVLLNLVIALLTFAWEEAFEESGNHYWAKRQYEFIVLEISPARQSYHTAASDVFDRWIIASLEKCYQRCCWRTTSFKRDGSSGGGGRCGGLYQWCCIRDWSAEKLSDHHFAEAEQRMAEVSGGGRQPIKPRHSVIGGASAVMHYHESPQPSARGQQPSYQGYQYESSARDTAVTTPATALPTRQSSSSSVTSLPASGSSEQTLVRQHSDGGPSRKPKASDQRPARVSIDLSHRDMKHSDASASKPAAASSAASAISDAAGKDTAPPEMDDMEEDEDDDDDAAYSGSDGAESDSDDDNSAAVEVVGGVRIVRRIYDSAPQVVRRMSATSMAVEGVNESAASAPSIPGGPPLKRHGSALEAEGEPGVGVVAAAPTASLKRIESSHQQPGMSAAAAVVKPPHSAAI